jgi:L-alanine-DL-glutamate epimerase-like enolase superfamily enzyme
MTIPQTHMMPTISGFELHKLSLPLGRTIGDNNCSYEVINLVALSLRGSDGHVAWGYSESVWQGRFKYDAWYVRPLPDADAIVAEFERTWWPRLSGRSVFDTEDDRLSYTSGHNWLDAAVRLALWDLMAQERGLPLYRLLNPAASRRDATAYASILDFPLSDAEVLDLTQRFILDGFQTVKVKIGADDVERDLRRLRLLRSYVGDDVRLTADANEAWDWQTALKRIETYLANGIELEYLEDPLRRDDVAGFAELTRRSPIPIIGHDYVDNITDLTRLVEYGGLQGIRTGKDIDHAMRCMRLAESASIGVYLGNSMFEVNAHLALAYDCVDRTEYSGLATNDILTEPIAFLGGRLQAPDRIGHGLWPEPDKLIEFASEGMDLKTQR